MKKIMILNISAIACVISTSVNSTDITGIYVGANGAYGTGTNHVRTGNDKNNLGLKGIGSGIHAGFQKDFNLIVVGLEGSASLNNVKGFERLGSYRINLKQKDTYGIAVRLGTKLNNWLTYIKLGYENTKFSEHITRQFLDNKKSIHTIHRLNSFVPGLGFETLISDHWIIGGEWAIALYKERKFKKKIMIEGEQVTQVDRHTPRISNFKLRLGYKF